ncbi:riboflavin synthase [Acidocella sp.]|uniref:riboflavin synthase n=1 Tax=Acidocella sp. TaxID=50710 RepID=UPI0026029B90|nr:riboflavin synthase [Acidocella sp.]
MFTGLITGVGTVKSVTALGQGRDARFTIEAPAHAPWAGHVAEIGASIAHSGVCLTVVESGPGWWAVEVSAETISKTSLGAWAPGTRVNLEASLRLGAEIGGHLVSGHVDGLARLLSVTPEHGSTRFLFELPAALAPYVAAKGSVALNGVSLTVNEVEGQRFGVNIIPHTLAHTNFHTLKPGDEVNVEIDMLARYVARQLAFSKA